MLLLIEERFIDEVLEGVIFVLLERSECSGIMKMEEKLQVDSIDAQKGRCKHGL